MKANQVMKKYGISRNTLRNWVKSGIISYELTPTGRYIYILPETKRVDVEY